MNLTRQAVALFVTVVGTVEAFAPARTANPAASSSSRLNLAVGEVAPDFTLTDQNGKTVTRSKIKKPLVVFFYPADSTPGCTIEAQTFNERIKTIRSKYGADVIGISEQDVESKSKFASELGLSFSILADKGDVTRKAFDVPRAAFGVLPGRVTYVLDAKGVCQAVYQDLANAVGHVDFAETTLGEMKAAK